MTDELDRRLESLAKAARASVQVAPDETERALADVTGGAQLARLHPADTTHRRSRARPWIAVAAATGTIVAGGVWLATRGSDRVTTVDPTLPAPAQSTIAEPASTVSATAPTSPPGTTRPAPGGPVVVETSVSHRDALPPAPLRPLNSVVVEGPEETLPLAAIGDLGVVVRNGDEPQVHIVGFDSDVRTLFVTPEIGVFTYGPGDVMYGLRWLDPADGGPPSVTAVAIPLSGLDNGRIVAESAELEALAWLETTTSPLGHGPEGIVDRERSIGDELLPYLDGATLDTPHVPPHLEQPSVDGVTTIVSDQLQIRLQIEREPGWKTEYVPPIPASGAGGTIVYPTTLGAAPDGAEFGGSSPVLMVATPTGDVRWYRIPAGWEYATSDLWGTVFVRRSGLLVEIALLGDITPVAPAAPAGPDPFAGLARQPTGIERRCYGDGWTCTTLLSDPYGTLYACDPVTMALSSYGAQPATTQLPACPMLIGPGPVAYLMESTGPESLDLVAVAIGGPSAGTELRRWTGALDVSGDTDYVATPDGIKTVGCCGLGMAADLERPAAFEWVLPPGVPEAPPFTVATVDTSDGAVIVADEQAWPLTEAFGEVWLRGATAVVPIDGGGALAQIYNMADGRLSLVRAWPDGALDVLPVGDPYVTTGAQVLERAGTVIVADGDTFARVDPFPRAAATVDLSEALAGWNWDDAGIARSCGAVWSEHQQVSQQRCTEVRIDPHGTPVSFDPVSRVVTRERREGADPVAFTLPDGYADASLLAAGPDDVVYFVLANEWPKASDVVAFALAPRDVGREIQRFPEALGIGDADVFATGTGLVVSGWYSPGLRPSGQEPVAVPWVQREDGAPPFFTEGAFGDADDIVSANGRPWSVAERTVRGDAPGTTRVVETFDRGFLALYTETQGQLRAELIRGWDDGTVEYVVLPVSWYALGGMILEPQGTVLIPNGERFARLAPFAERAPGWEGRLEIDVETGTATAVGLQEYLEPLDWPETGASHLPPWGSEPEVYANAVVGPVSSAATLRTIVVEHSDAQYSHVIVTDENLLDDSVHAVRWRVVHSAPMPDGPRAPESISWSQACQPGRGHQDFQPALCT